MRNVALFAMLSVLLICTPPVLTAPARADDCTITLGTTPEPPDCAPPGTGVTIFWLIVHDTTPDFVYYRLTDPDGALVEEEVYPGTTGINVNRVWNVPETAMDGVYLVHIEYWSQEVGLEGFAEVVFLVCTGTPTDDSTWGQIKDLFR